MGEVRTTGGSHVSGYAEGALSTRVAEVWGHYSAEVLSGSILAVIAVRIVPPQGALMLTVPLALVMVVLTSWLLMRRHDRMLCEACMHAMPLNAAEKAKRYQNRFLMAHSMTERRFLLPYLAVLIGSNFFPGTWGLWAWAIVQSSMIYLLMSHVAHRRFQPWCPWCSNGGGGSEHDEDVTPPPLPDNDRQLV